MNEITSEGRYYQGRATFLEQLIPYWATCKSQVLKYESCQSQAILTGNPSWEALNEGDWRSSLQLIRKSKEGDALIYRRLREEQIEITRCRPISAPMSAYVKWEIQNYFVNEEMGERVFVCNYISVKEFVDEFAPKDFIVFDGRRAFVYNTTDEGLICGGWEISEFSSILSLMAGFMFVKSQSSRLAKVYKEELRFG